MYYVFDGILFFSSSIYGFFYQQTCWILQFYRYTIYIFMISINELEQTKRMTTLMIAKEFWTRCATLYIQLLISFFKLKCMIAVVNLHCVTYCLCQGNERNFFVKSKWMNNESNSNFNYLQKICFERWNVSYNWY